MKKWILYGILAYAVVFLFCLFGVYLPSQRNRAQSTTQATMMPEQTVVVIVPTEATEPTNTPIATDAPIQSPTSEPTSTGAPTSTPIPVIGQDVITGDVRWKFLSATDVGNTIESTNQFVANAVTPGKFLVVRFEIENIGKDQVSYSSFSIKDMQDRRFTAVSNPFALIPEEENCGGFMNLNPNLPRTCQVIFELPSDATGITVEVDNFALLFGRESSTVGLTPP